MTAHAVKYSPGYKRDLDKGSQYTFWSKDFDGMAYKTMLRQLISKWGIVSIELQTAIDKDMAVLNEDGEARYVESDDASIIEQEEPRNEEPAEEDVKTPGQEKERVPDIQAQEKEISEEEYYQQAFFN